MGHRPRRPKAQAQFRSIRPNARNSFSNGMGQAPTRLGLCELQAGLGMSGKVLHGQVTRDYNYWCWSVTRPAGMHRPITANPSQPLQSIARW
jgi:hypothetical protein